MNAILRISLSNLRKKKLQNGLIAVLILLSALLLSTAGSVILNSRDRFETLHNETKGSHQILMLDKGIHDRNKVYDWWSSQEGIKTSLLLPYRNISGIFYKGLEIQNVYLYMMDTNEQASAVDKLIFAEGEETFVPESGTVWIPTSLAYSKGINKGELLEFGSGADKIKLRVSAVVIDIPYCAPFENGARIWMNDGDYKQISGVNGENRYMFGIRYEDYTKRSLYWDRFEEFLAMPYLESIKSFESITAFYLIMGKIIGFIMSFLGTAMIAIALYTIGFTITEAILSEYKTLGIVRSLGLPSWGITVSYVLQYAFLCVVAIIPGIAVSNKISVFLVDISLTYIKIDNLKAGETGIFTGILIGGAVFLLVMFITLIRSRNIKSVEPVQAIRYGMSETESSRLTKRLGAEGTKLNFDKYPVSFVIGARNLIKNRKTAILMFTLTGITSAVIIFGILLLNSIINIYKTSPQWGYDNSQVAVTFLNPSEEVLEHFKNDIKADPRIKNTGWYSGTTGIFRSQKEGALSSSTYINLDVLDGSYEELGYTVLKGRNPENKNEIALGIRVARQLEKDIGDLAEVYIEGKKYTLTVVGVYQSIANMSETARITAGTLNGVALHYPAAEAGFINLKDIRDSDSLVKEINEKYRDSLTAVTQKTLIEDVYSEAAAILIFPVLFIGFLFIFATYIIIYCTCRINIRKESKTYGIYKSLGMTTLKIRTSIMGGIGVMALAGILTGMAAGIYLLPFLMERILADYGIVKLPIIINQGGIILAVFLILSAICLGSWFSTASVRNTSPKMLIIE